MTARINFMIARSNPHLAPESTVVAVAVRALINVAVARGASRHALLCRSGIREEELADPHNRVALDRYLLLMRAGKELCRDPAFALHFGEAVDVTEVSIASTFGATSTIDDACAQMNRYGRLGIDVETAGDGDRWLLERSAGHLWVVDARRNPNDSPELTESAFARMVCSTRRSVGDAMLEEVHVTHAAPVYRSEYERVFRVPVVFGSDKNALRLDESVLSSLRAPPSSRYVQELLRTQADAMLEQLDRDQTTRRRVEKVLMPLLQSGRVRVETVGKQLGLSRQTLFRRLRKEGVAFEQVADELRHRLAVHYLAANRVSVQQTAYLLGYSDASAFSRAFKRWTGYSPREVRSRRGVS